MECNPISKQHRDKVQELYEYYNSKGNLVQAYGMMHDTNPMIGIAKSRLSEHAQRDTKIRKNIADLFLDTNNIPLDDGFIPQRNGKLDLSVYNQVKRSIDRWDKSLEKGINGFEALARVPSGIYSKNPVTIEFNRKMSSIQNMERKNRSKYVHSLKQINKDLNSVMSKYNGKRNSMKKSINKIDQIQNRIAEKMANNEDYSAEMYEMRDFLESADTQKVLQAYTYMMENFSKNDLQDSKNFVGLKSDDGTIFDKNMLMDLRKSVRESKTLLNNMAETNIAGLQKARDVADKLYSKISGGETYRLRALKSNLDNAVKRIKKGTDEDKYFPHYAIDSLIRLEKILDTTDLYKVTEDKSYAEQSMEYIEKAVNSLNSEMLGASKEKSNLFRINPLKVLESYSENATIFNKKQFSADAFLEAIRDINPRNADFEGLTDMAEYMHQKFISSTQGSQHGNPTVTKSMGILAKLETISKMGLSLSGALRNSTQHFWYTTQVGLRRYNQGRSALSSSQDYDLGSGQKETLKQIVNKAAKDAGYSFDNIVSEITSRGGVLDDPSIDKRSINVEMDDNGVPRVTFRRDGVLTSLDQFLGKAAGKSLMFHQVTENIVRRDVYNNAFAIHFQKLYGNEDYKESLRNKTKDDGSKIFKTEAQINAYIKDQSHNMALNWVRTTQFDYSKFDRPVLFGGGTGNLSSVGNTVFQFFPYAAHMFEMNKKVMSGGWDAMKAGDYNSYKFGAAARLIGFQTFGIGLASILFNNQFRYLIDNDTFARLTNLYDLFTTDHPTEKNFGNGLIAQMTGPVVSDMLFWMEAAGFTDFSDEKIAQLLLGHYKFAEKSDSEKDRAMLNKLSVSMAKVFNSSGSFVKGDFTGILRNNFVMYPDGFTKSSHKWLMEQLGLSDTRKVRRAEEQINDTLTSVPQEFQTELQSAFEELRKLREVGTSERLRFDDFASR